MHTKQFHGTCLSKHLPAFGEIINTVTRSKGAGNFLDETKRTIIEDIECMRTELNQTAITKGVNSTEVLEISRKLDSMINRFIKNDF